MNIESIVIHTDIKDKLALLTDEEAGQLFKAILAYAEDGTEIAPGERSGAVVMAFLFVRDQIARDYKKYIDSKNRSDERSETYRENAKKRWAKRKGAEDSDCNANECNCNANECNCINGNANEALPISIPIEPISTPIEPNCIPKEDKGKAKRFIKPSLQEIEQCIKEKGYNIDAGAFYDYYEANGWVQGKGKPIKNWKAALSTWNRRSGSFGQAPQTRELSFKSDNGDNPAKEDYGKKDYSMRFGTTTTKEKKNWGERF